MKKTKYVIAALFLFAIICIVISGTKRKTDTPPENGNNAAPTESISSEYNEWTERSYVFDKEKDLYIKQINKMSMEKYPFIKGMLYISYLETENPLDTTNIVQVRKLIKADLRSGMTGIACESENCLHEDNDVECTGNIRLKYYCCSEDTLFYVDRSYDHEIRKIQNGRVDSIFSAGNSIRELWYNDGFIYFNTDFDLRRVDVNSKEETVVLNQPVLFSYLFFYGDSMYYIDESFAINKAEPDGSGAAMIFDGLKAITPIVYGDRIYFRNYSAESDYNNLAVCSVDLDGNNLQCEIEEGCFRYFVLDKGIYYSTLPADKCYIDGMYCGLVSSVKLKSLDDGNVSEIITGITGDFAFAGDENTIIFCAPAEYDVKRMKKQYPDLTELPSDAGSREFLYDLSTGRKCMIVL